HLVHHVLQGRLVHPQDRLDMVVDLVDLPAHVARADHLHVLVDGDESREIKRLPALDARREAQLLLDGLVDVLRLIQSCHVFLQSGCHLMNSADTCERGKRSRFAPRLSAACTTLRVPATLISVCVRSRADHVLVSAATWKTTSTDSGMARTSD